MATSALAGSYLDHKKTASLSCRQLGVDHRVTIKQNKVLPARTQGHLCDQLTIINSDDVLREMAFGEHEHHQAYDGIYEQNLAKDQSFTITLNKLGSFRFHDHFDDAVNGVFAVAN